MSLTYADLIEDKDILSLIGFIDLDYYKDTYLGEDPDDDTALTKYIKRATDDVNAHCGWILDDDLTDLDDDTKNLVYKATAAQAEWYVLNGESYNDDDSTSVSISKFSYGGNAKASVKGVKLCNRALMYIEQTTLMFRGVGC